MCRDGDLRCGEGHNPLRRCLLHDAGVQHSIKSVSSRYAGGKSCHLGRVRGLLELTLVTHGGYCRVFWSGGAAHGQPSTASMSRRAGLAMGRHGGQKTLASRSGNTWERRTASPEAEVYCSDTDCPSTGLSGGPRGPH